MNNKICFIKLQAIIITTKIKLNHKIYDERKKKRWKLCIFYYLQFYPKIVSFIVLKLKSSLNLVYIESQAKN